MKYFDKNTIRNNSNWQNREPNIYNEYRIELKKREKKIRKEIQSFSNNVDDKMWWNSLTDDDKRSLYMSYRERLSSAMASRRLLRNSDIKWYNDDARWLDNWIKLEIIRFKSIYHPQIDVRRNLVISEILK